MLIEIYVTNSPCLKDDFTVVLGDGYLAARVSHRKARYSRALVEGIDRAIASLVWLAMPVHDTAVGQ